VIVSRSSTCAPAPTIRSGTRSRPSSAARTPSALSRRGAATIPSLRATCGSRSGS